MTLYEKVNFTAIILTCVIISIIASLVSDAISGPEALMATMFYIAGIFWGHVVTIDRKNERNQ